MQSAIGRALPPPIFLAGHADLARRVYAHIPRTRLLGLLLVVIAPAMVLLPPILIAVAVALVLSGVVIVDAKRWVTPEQQGGEAE